MSIKTATLKCSPSGLVTAVNNLRLKQIPYWLMTDSPNNRVLVPAFGQNGPISMSVSRDGPAEVVNFSVENDGAAQVLFEIDDGSNPLALMNAPVHIGTILGTGIQPYILPNAINVDELRKLRVTLTDLSGVDNNIRIVGQCYRPMVAVPDPKMVKARVRKSNKQYLMGLYFYTTCGGPISLTPAAPSAEVSIDIDNMRHFKLMQMSRVADGSFNIDILNGQTGESLLDAPSGQHYEIPDNLIWGDAHYPFKFQRGRLFQRDQKIVVRVTDTSGLPSNKIYLTFAGQFITSNMWEA